MIKVRTVNLHQGVRNYEANLLGLVGMGEKFDQTATRAMPAGTFGFWPAEMRHFAWAKGELQVHGTDRWMITYVNPSDDPRKPK